MQESAWKVLFLAPLELQGRCAEFSSEQSDEMGAIRKTGGKTGIRNASSLGEQLCRIGKATRFDIVVRGDLQIAAEPTV